jgi:hypothetical protein
MWMSTATSLSDRRQPRLDQEVGHGGVGLRASAPIRGQGHTARPTVRTRSSTSLRRRSRAADKSALSARLSPAAATAFMQSAPMGMRSCGVTQSPCCSAFAAIRRTSVDLRRPASPRMVRPRSYSPASRRACGVHSFECRGLQRSSLWTRRSCPVWPRGPCAVQRRPTQPIWVMASSRRWMAS